MQNKMFSQEFTRISKKNKFYADIKGESNFFNKVIWGWGEIWATLALCKGTPGSMPRINPWWCPGDHM